MNETAGVRPDRLDPFTIVVLRRRVEATIREMSRVLARSGRSGVLNTALDFSCSITDSKLQAISTALGLPIHVGGISLIPAAILEKHGADIAPGDCFATNSPYFGNTHCADLTLCAPVFVEGELVFFSIARAHLSDIGFPTPTTYSPQSKDYYDEGLWLPCVRIQRANRDIPEVIEICKANIRGPELFYGDYLAVLAAVRTGEKRLQELVASYGVDMVRRFLDQFQDYAEAMAVAEIRKLPAGSATKEVCFDSDLLEYRDGLPIRATLTVDPEEGFITVDLRDNVNNVPAGINLTESTVTACCTSGVLNVLGPSVPRCTGSMRRLRLLMRGGSAIGRPRFPAATAAATTSLAQLLTPLIQSLFAELTPRLGTAAGAIGQPGSMPCVSGVDSRHGGWPFFNQIILGYWSGPALVGHDGWLTYGSGGSHGMLWQSSVEVVEQQQPLIVEKLELRVDSGGVGEFEGAPGAICSMRARADAVRFSIVGGGRRFPPFGTLGGGPGAPNANWRVARDGTKEALPLSPDVTVEPGESLLSHGCGGGGFGDPLGRDPERVRRGVREGWISLERARRDYGVVIDTTSELFAVDREATALLRQQMAGEAIT